MSKWAEGSTLLREITLASAGAFLEESSWLWFSRLQRSEVVSHLCARFPVATVAGSHPPLYVPHNPPAWAMPFLIDTFPEALFTYYDCSLFLFFFFSFIFISWRLTTLQYCSGICHTLT